MHELLARQSVTIARRGAAAVAVGLPALAWPGVPVRAPATGCVLLAMAFALRAVQAESHERAPVEPEHVDAD